MSYIDEIADALYDRISAKKGRPTTTARELLLAYAALVLVKGTRTTAEDIHDTWAGWAAAAKPGDGNLVRFRHLSRAAMAQDIPYLESVRELAAERTPG